MPPDVAISAPFGEGTGTVYIYRGSRQGIVTTPEQTLTPNRLNLMESVVSGVTTFGAHLSGTTDIDGNKHNGEDLCTTVLLYCFTYVYVIDHALYVYCVPTLLMTCALLYCRSSHWELWFQKSVCSQVWLGASYLHSLTLLAYLSTLLVPPRMQIKDCSHCSDLSNSFHNFSDHQWQQKLFL